MVVLARESEEKNWPVRCVFPRLLFHDDACHMLPFLRRRARLPYASWVLKLLAECDMRVDRFHLKNHCDECSSRLFINSPRPSMFSQV